MYFKNTISPLNHNDCNFHVNIIVKFIKYFFIIIKFKYKLQQTRFLQQCIFDSKEVKAYYQKED